MGTGDLVRFGVCALSVPNARIVPVDYEKSEIVVLRPSHDDSSACAPFALVVGISPFDLIANLVPIGGDCLRCLDWDVCPTCEDNAGCHDMPAFRWLDLIQHTIGYLV